MKKISLLALILAASTVVFAQSPKFGLKAGLNIATMSNIPGVDWNSRLGLNAGALAHIHLSPQVALQPEVVFSGQGAKYTVGTAGDEHDLILNYINIPVQLQYMFDNGFRLQTGPQVGFLIDVKDKLNGQETGFFTSDDFKDIDFSWTLGLGYLTNSGFGVDGRYNLGISNINEAGTNKLRNNVFQVGIFYMLDNSHKAKSR
jgi:hypothetical protein